jgi:hypothetical protein
MSPSPRPSFRGLSLVHALVVIAFTAAHGAAQTPTPPTPVATDPTTETAIMNFAAMTREEVDRHTQDVRRQIGDLTLVPPTINTKPLPEFDYPNLDYAMTLGIERTPGGRLWFFFDQSINHYDGRQGLWASICTNPDDDEPAWSKPVRLWHGCLLNKPVVMSNGEWWLPVEFPVLKPLAPMVGVHEALDPLRGANVLVSKDQGRTWELRGRVRSSRPDWDEHMFLELNDGRVWMVARVHDRENGVRQSFSSDGG